MSKRQLTRFKSQEAKNTLHRVGALQKMREASFRGKPMKVGSKVEAEFVSRLAEDPAVKSIVEGSRLPKIIYKNVTEGGLGYSFYFPDLGYVVEDGTEVLVEVKSPFTLLMGADGNLRKFAAARLTAKRNGGKFLVAVKEKSGTWKTFFNPSRKVMTDYMISLS